MKQYKRYRWERVSMRLGRLTEIFDITPDMMAIVSSMDERTIRIVPMDKLMEYCSYNELLKIKMMDDKSYLQVYMNDEVAKVIARGAMHEAIHLAKSEPHGIDSDLEYIQKHAKI